MCVSERSGEADEVLPRAALCALRTDDFMITRNYVQLAADFLAVRGQITRSLGAGVGENAERIRLQITLRGLPVRIDDTKI